MIRIALRRAARITIERPRTAAWTTLALTCALFVAAIAGVVALTIDRWAADRPGSTARMVVYLGDGVTDERGRILAGELRALRGVERAELVSSSESARRLVAALGSDAALLEGIEPGAMPASVEVTLAPGVRDVVAMSPTVRALRGTAGVADVVVDDPADDKIASALGGIRAVAWSGATLFAVLAAVLALAIVRVRLDRDRRELAVAELFGAGPGFVVVPTALAGALHGLVATWFALGLLGVTASYSDSVPIQIVMPDANLVAGFVGAGTLLGLLAGALAGASRVTRYRIAEATCGAPA